MKNNKKNKEITAEAKNIMSSIEQIKNELAVKRNNFDLATNETLIDSYIYEIIALNKKYEYFLQQAKEMGLVAQGFKKTS